MSKQLKKITLHGYKSIEFLDDFELKNLTVLIGANGAGKSNFVDFFRMLRALADENFQSHINTRGGGDSLFFLGPKHTRQITAHLEFGDNIYEFDLEPASDGRVVIAQERVQYTEKYGIGELKSIARGQHESVLKKPALPDGELDNFGFSGTVPGYYVYSAISDWTVYHFHDTSSLAPMRREQSQRDWESLRPDASNIAAFLSHLQETHIATYELIRDTIRLIAPFFNDFLFRSEEQGGLSKIRLEWHQKGSDFPFQPSQLSDGTIRFICLATALLQPSLPATIVIDEPELGLHPYAISLLADLIKSASQQTQVIVSTQSPTLLDYFEPDDVVVVNRVNSRSTFRRLEQQQLNQWLDEYSVGELWQKNVVQGGPTHE